MILIYGVKLVEISAPAPDANDKVFMRFGIPLRLDKRLAVDGVQLKLMTSKVNKRLDQRGNLFDAVLVTEGVAVYLHRERSAVDDLGKIVFCEGEYAGERAVYPSVKRGRKA